MKLEITTGADGMGIITDYIETFSPEQQRQANDMYHFLQKLLPEAEEKMSYGMPALAMRKPVVYFRVAKSHIGFYPLPETIEKFARELAPYHTSKGAIQFPLDQPLPYDLIKEMVAYRVAHRDDAPAP